MAEPSSKRGTSIEISILEKLQQSPEFSYYLDLLEEAIRVGWTSLKVPVQNEVAICDHNVTVGMIMGLEKALTLVDNHLAEAEQRLAAAGSD